MGERNKVDGAKLKWVRSITPRNAFISWIFIHHRLPTKTRLSNYNHQGDTTCILYNQEDEDEAHLFFDSSYASEIWGELQNWWQTIPQARTSQSMISTMLKSKTSKKGKMIICTIIFAAIYHI